MPDHIVTVFHPNITAISPARTSLNANGHLTIRRVPLSQRPVIISTQSAVALCDIVQAHHPYVLLIARIIGSAYYLWFSRRQNA